MFAVIVDGSRQHRVSSGTRLSIDYRSSANNGDTITFDNILLANGGGASVIGTPAIEGATVEAKVVEALVKGPKLEVQKIRRRKNSKRHTGHRQKYTEVEIKAISVPGLEVVEAPAEEAAPAPVVEESAPAAEEAPAEATASEEAAE